MDKGYCDRCGYEGPGVIPQHAEPATGLTCRHLTKYRDKEGIMYREDEDRLATPGEAIREYAENAGGDRPECAWLLTDYDVWVRNPHYKGPPQPHPEDAIYMDEEDL